MISSRMIIRRMMGEAVSVNKIIYTKRRQFINYYDVFFEGDQFPEQIELFLPDYENAYTYSIALAIPKQR